MQLFEQGKLDLETDINTYLHDFQIPAAFSEPITLSHLLTHTHGFANRMVGTEARNSTDLLSLAEVVVNYLPDRVRPPGELASYSDYSAALAGYIVEQVSGVPFQQYVEQYILEPLGMLSSTFQQPVPLELAANTSFGYIYSNGDYQIGDFQYLQLAPANAMSATATDIARFMIAHLQDGLYGNTRILNVSTANDMQRQHFTHDSHLSGVTYGFVEMKLNNEQLIGHTGGIRHFSTLLVLLPEHNVGLFASYNTADSAPNELLHAFLDHFYPALNYPVSQPPVDFLEHAYVVQGTYRPTYSQYTTLEKVGELLNLVSVDTSSDGVLLLTQNDSGPKRRVEVAPLIYHQVNGQNILVFHEDSQEHTIYMFNDYAPYTAFIKLHWYETPVFHGSLLAICLLIFLTVLLHPTRSFYIRRRRKVNLPRDTVLRLADWIVIGISGLAILFTIGCLVVIVNPEFILYGLSPIIYCGLSVTFIIAILTTGAIVLTLFFWRKGYLSIGSRSHYTLVTLAATIFTWQLHYFNLLGFNL
jgi:CubicO group peptidase (beta-lactamase class C family)